MTRRLFPILLLAAAVGTAGAAGTRTFSTTSYKDFSEGEGERALISSAGEVAAGARATRTDLGIDTATAAVRAADGTIYVGATADGAVLAWKKGQVTRAATLAERSPWVGSLAVLPDGGVVAGLLGAGQIVRLDGKGGATLLADLEGADHVWAMVVDGPTLWAATGPEGKLFAVDLASGKAKVAWESKQKHILALLRTADGALWLGTSDEAILYRFDPKAGRARAIADFSGQEIRALAEIPGGVAAAVNEFEQKGGGPPAPPAQKGPKGTTQKAPDAGSAPGADKAAPADAAAARPGERKGKGTIYRVEPDGRTEQLHALAEGYFQALVSLPGGELIAGAGTGGRVYRIRPDRSVVTAFDFAERQVNVVLAWDGGLAFATGDGGALYEAGGPADDAVYTSKAFDAGFAARFGLLRYRGDGLTVETRSGNTAKPDEAWSAWQALDVVAAASGARRAGRVVSPPGRYLQYRALLGAKGTLDEVTIYYLAQNQRPRVTEIAVGDSGDTPKPAVLLQAGPSKPRSPVIKLKWKVENPDSDELVCVVEVRPESGEWQRVPTDTDPFLKTELDWNTEALPDGLYRLRVTASDGRANSPELALDGSLISAPFLLDNRRPELVDVVVGNGAVAGRAVDATSRIDEITYQIDGGGVVVLFPKDGLFDDLVESWSFRVPPLPAGVHTIVVRAADELDNIGAITLTYRAP